MRAYCVYDGKHHIVQVEEARKQGGMRVVEVISKHKAARAAIEEAERWNAKHAPQQ